MEDAIGVQSNQWKRKKKNGKSKKVKSKTIANRKQLGHPFMERDRDTNELAKDGCNQERKNTGKGNASFEKLT